LPEHINVKVEAEMSKEEQEKLRQELEEQQARAKAQVLVNLGDIPDVDIKPPENVLFVCRLNPITTEDDLLIIFGKYGGITDCEIIRVWQQIPFTHSFQDKKTGDSLCYAFISYNEQSEAEEAYFKMDNVLIDERRIHVDFSQSVAKVDFMGEGGWRNFFGKRAMVTIYFWLIELMFQQYNSKRMTGDKTPSSGPFSRVQIKSSAPRGQEYSMILDDGDNDRGTKRTRDEREDRGRRGDNRREGDRRDSRRDDRREERRDDRRDYRRDERRDEPRREERRDEPRRGERRDDYRREQRRDGRPDYRREERPDDRREHRDDRRDRDSHRDHREGDRRRDYR
jgi:peptidyl-prolyl cis-trans isomerase-like 4